MRKAMIAANLWLRFAWQYERTGQVDRLAYAVGRVRHYDRQARILARTAAN